MTPTNEEATHMRQPVNWRVCLDAANEASEQWDHREQADGTSSVTTKLPSIEYQGEQWNDWSQSQSDSPYPHRLLSTQCCSEEVGSPVVIAAADSVIVHRDELDSGTVKGNFRSVSPEYGILSADPGYIEELLAGAVGSDLHAFPNLLFNFNPLRYHPGTPKTAWLNQDKPDSLNTVQQRPVIVLDTADLASKPGMHLYTSDGLVDKQVDDETGHGPAIADLVCHMVGNPDGTCLVGITSDVGRVTPDGHRAFLYSDLLAALHRVEVIIEHLVRQGHRPIVNMSFGTKSCPELTDRGEQGDPLARRLAHWGTHADFVAAAGNSQVSTPTYPAAWGAEDPWGIEQPNIKAVGSRDAAGQSEFSDHGGWVSNWADAEGVVLEGENGKYIQGGTSFAAPQIAARLACGLTI